MTSINEIFRTFGPEYLQRYANSMPKTHLKVIDAMIACRTEACGLALYQCESCSASSAGISRSPTTPAAIATAPPANSIRPDSG